MKLKWILLFALPLGWSGCDRRPGGVALLTADDRLAREVTGIHLLSTDLHYGSPCGYLRDEQVREAFGLAAMPLQFITRPNGCAVRWNGGSVVLTLLNGRPFASIYHAEFVFDRLYAPRRGALARAQTQVEIRYEPLSGPAPAGTGAEGPNPSGGEFKNKRLPLVRGYVPVDSLGDKAIWEPAQGILHVLHTNHIVNVQVETNREQVQKKGQAIQLAKGILAQLNH